MKSHILYIIGFIAAIIIIFGYMDNLIGHTILLVGFLLLAFSGEIKQRFTRGQHGRTKTN